MLDTVEQFMAALADSLSDGTFVKMTLGNYKGGDEHLQKIHIRQIVVKGKPRLFFLYRYNTRDTAKNFSFDDGCELIGKLLEDDFHSGHLFTTTNDLQLDIGKKGRSRLNRAKATFKNRRRLNTTVLRRPRSTPTPFTCGRSALQLTRARSGRSNRTNGGRSINLSRSCRASSTNLCLAKTRACEWSTWVQAKVT